MSQKKAMLIDTTRCVSCGLCEGACQAENNLPELGDDEPRILSERAYTVVVERKCVDQNGEEQEYKVREMCRHCNVPACKSVCLVNAFHKTDEGAVLYDKDKCIGCRYCVQACPFHIPKYNWHKDWKEYKWLDRVKPKVVKCVLCHERISKGGITACAEACEDSGTGATIFGDYGVVVDEAKKRVAENPEGYYPKIYGLAEAGGTTVLYLSAVPFEDLGFDTKRIPDEPIRNLTHAALSKVPNVVGVGAVMLGGIWWITHRRHEVAEHEANNHNDSSEQK